MGAIGAAVLWFAVVGSGGKQRVTVFREKDPPATWNVSEVDDRLPDGQGYLHVLAWEIVDDGESVLERCLVLKRYSRLRPDGTSCVLAYLNRHPRDEKA